MSDHEKLSGDVAIAVNQINGFIMLVGHDLSKENKLVLKQVSDRLYASLRNNGFKTDLERAIEEASNG